jgi:hypothetical protein
LHGAQAQLTARARSDTGEIVWQRSESAQRLSRALGQLLPCFRHLQRGARAALQNPHPELGLQARKRVR